MYDTFRLTGARLAGATDRVTIVVRHGQVIAVEPDGHATAVEPDGTSPRGAVESIDLDGRTVVPGLWDAHVHLTQWALARRRLDLSAATSAAQVVDLVRERLHVDAAHRGGPPTSPTPLVGFGFRDGLWPDAPTATLLDEVAGGLPVVLVSGDLHCAWASTAGLRFLGITDHPTGVLREDEWMALQGTLDQVPTDVVDGWVAEAGRAAAARGVVGVVDLEIADNLSVWRRRAAAGFDALRVRAGVWEPHLDRVLREELHTGDVVAGTGGLVAQGPLKVITDGSLNTRTAFCADPYPEVVGSHDHGMLTVAPDELVPLMRHARAHGLTCAIHAIGDRANTFALDAFAASGARGSVEHAQLLLPDDVPRLAALGLTASVQPEHAMDDRDVADIYWAGRTGRAFPLADLVAAGVRLTLGSDAPVAPLDPWVAIDAAVHRARDGRDPWHPEQRIDVRTALAASVDGVPLTIAAGHQADLAILDADPLAPGASLRDLPVAGTLLGGRWTHRTF
ncbi:amidohydrolase [Oerskovia flava]|uniref:amidohydrolase n=1 Tax=Oerskovia flava TaxID=2986422 RepID=UPI00223F835A|nr:amidohydrolase family protein [Oerskovia sp. JB1-3-2]